MHGIYAKNHGNIRKLMEDFLRSDHRVLVIEYEGSVSTRSMVSESWQRMHHGLFGFSFGLQKW